MRDKRERERERKRERKKKPKNQKFPSSSLLPLFLLPHSLLLFLHSCFEHTRATNRPSEKMGKKGTPASKKKQSPGAAAKTPSLPNKVSRDSYFFSFLFSLTTLSSSGCVAFWKFLIFRPPERIIIIIIIVFRNAVSYFNIIG